MWRALGGGGLARSELVLVQSDSRVGCSDFAGRKNGAEDEEAVEVEPEKDG